MGQTVRLNAPAHAPDLHTFAILHSTHDRAARLWRHVVGRVIVVLAHVYVTRHSIGQLLKHRSNILIPGLPIREAAAHGGWQNFDGRTDAAGK